MASRGLSSTTVVMAGISAAWICVAVFMGLLISVPLVITAIFTGPLSQICSSGDATDSGQPTVIQASAKSNSIPKNYLALYQKAGAEYNIPWNILAGIGWVETQHGTFQGAGVQSGENSKGAGGPMQFIGPTWDAYGVDGDGDGKKDRYNPADAIPAAARYLKASGAPGDIPKAIRAYNHSDIYVRDVLAAANRYAHSSTVAPANYAGQSCPVGASLLQGGSFGQRIVSAAAAYARRDKGAPNPPGYIGHTTPYSWGGGSLKGPSPGFDQGAGIVGFDCSSLSRYAVYVASGGKITTPRTVDAIYRSNLGVKVSRSQLAPGDLVFFDHLLHMGIYYGVFNGKRWIVEAPHTGDFVKFIELDAFPVEDYVGALRIKEPQRTAQAMAPPAARPAVV